MYTKAVARGHCRTLLRCGAAAWQGTGDGVRATPSHTHCRFMLLWRSLAATFVGVFLVLGAYVYITVSQEAPRNEAVGAVHPSLGDRPGDEPSSSPRTQSAASPAAQDPLTEKAANITMHGPSNDSLSAGGPVVTGRRGRRGALTPLQLPWWQRQYGKNMVQDNTSDAPQFPDPTPAGCPHTYFSFINNFGGHSNQVIPMTLREQCQGRVGGYPGMLGPRVCMPRTLSGFGWKG